MIGNNDHNIIKKITEHFKNMDFDAGYKILKSSNLSHAATLECEGNAEFYRKNYQNAFEIYGRVTDMDNEYRISRYYYLWASDFFAKGDLVQAFEYYQESIDLDPEFVDAYIDLGALMASIGEFASAKKCYEDAMAIDPEDINIRKSLNSLRKM